MRMDWSDRVFTLGRQTRLSVDGGYPVCVIAVLKTAYFNCNSSGLKNICANWVLRLPAVLYLTLL